MATVRMQIQLPDHLLQALLQDIRNFEMSHDTERGGVVHFDIGIEAPGLDAATIQAIFRNVRPPFEHEWVFQSPGVA